MGRRLTVPGPRPALEEPGLNITASQIFYTLLAIPAFIPVTICPGYLVASLLNLHRFRERSLVERVFWCLPLSLSASTITSVLLGKFLSLNAIVVFLWIGTALSFAMVAKEWLERRHTGAARNLGWKPLGGKAFALALLWVAGSILSLVDVQKD